MKLAATVAATCVIVSLGYAAHAADRGVLRKLADNKFAPQPGFPGCVTMAVESGDPSSSASVIVFKAAPGCVIPWHWHTANEHVIVVNGAARMEMKEDGSSALLGPGGYAMLPSKHAHQFSCTAACTAFVVSDRAFDIHYIDPNGNEIAPDVALKKK